jgi:hypothetical protein
MRWIAIISVGLTMSALASGAGAAQPSLTDQVKDGCRAELASYCKDVTAGEGRLLACLYAFEDKLSSRCDYALYDASSRLEHAVAALAHGATECKSDIEKPVRLSRPARSHRECLRNRAPAEQALPTGMKDIGLD